MMLLSGVRNGRRPLPTSVAPEVVTVVRVRGGYDPDVVHARAGARIRLAFLREETASCSERVVFPAFGKSVMLPHGEIVVVELPSRAPGTYAFTCALDMLRGTLVVH